MVGKIGKVPLANVDMSCGFVETTIGVKLHPTTVKCAEAICEVDIVPRGNGPSPTANIESGHLVLTIGLTNVSGDISDDSNEMREGKGLKLPDREYFLFLFEKLETGCPESPRPIPISTYSRYEEANLVLFANILSIILRDPEQIPDPVPEHALDVAKNRSFHPFATTSSISSLEENSRSLRTYFNIPKSQKSHTLIYGE
jgi:hypothetical protein